jgi:hypothetical protein
VPAKEWNLVGEFPALVDGDDGECASAARFPIDRKIFGVCLGASMAVISATIPAHIDSRKAELLTFTRLVSQAFRLIWRLS